MQDKDASAGSKEEGIRFSELLKNVQKHLVAVILCIVAGIGAGAVFYATQPVKYTSEGTMLIDYAELDGETGNYTYVEYANAERIAETFTAVVSHDVVLKEVEKEFEENKLTAAQIRGGLSVSYESLLITVKYTAEDPVLAERVVNAVMKTAKSVSDSVGENAEPRFKTLYNRLSIMMEGKGAVASKPLTGFFLFAAGGVLAAGVYVAVRVATDKRFKSEEEVEAILNIPVLADIPYYKFESAEKTR